MRPTYGMMAVTALMLSVACNANPDLSEEQQTYLVYDYDSDQERYELVKADISTLTSPTSADGEVAYIRGGGKIVINHSDPQTEAEFETAISVDSHEEPNLEYAVDEEDVVVAWDFDSLMMLTLYHHLETSWEYFESIDFDSARVGRMPVFYFPNLSLLGIPLPFFTDNAAYSYTMDAFLIPPRYLLDDVPLSANRGVIVHEYSHAVFNRIIYQDRRVPRFLVEDWPDEPVEQLRSLDEGVADVFAALATGDPDFISPSISAELFDIDRDLDRDRYYDDALVRRIEEESEDAHNPYILGSVVASTLWDLRDDIDDETLGRAVIASLEQLAGPTTDFDISLFFNALLLELPSDVTSNACDLFEERLVLIRDRLDCQ